MTHAEPRHEPLLTDAVACLGTFVMSGTAAAFVLADTLPIIAYLFAHVGSAALAVLVSLKSGTPPRRQSLLHAMMTTAMGPVGSAGCFLCCMLELAFRPNAKPFSEWFESIFPDEQDNDQSAFLELLHSSEDPLRNSMRISSFRDTMAAGTIEQKQALLGLIARRFSPSFAPALHQALCDPVPAIRVQAAAAAASIENRYAEKTFELTQRTHRATRRPEDYLALAGHLLEFAESGIAEPSRTEEARKSALGQYDRYLALRSTDPRALMASARLLLHFGNANEANERIRVAISMTGMTSEVAAIQMQALFQLNHFDEIRKHARHWLDASQAQSRDGQRLRNAMKLWVGNAAHAR